jgi:hypothetical protein
MGKASSAKKVARAARAGGRGARGGQRRSILFPASITVICVLGVSLILYARSQDEAQALEPGVTDHWHAAYGVDICGTVQPPFTNDADPNGTHTHGDGVIHIHPGAATQVARAGEDATLGVFMAAAGAVLTDDSISIPDETGELVTYTEGEDQCDGEDGQVQVAYWANATEANDTDPQIFTDNLADIFFQNDREAFTIAFVPEGEDIAPPSTVGDLDELAGIDGGDTVTSTVPPGSTVPGGASTTSTPAGEPSASTTAPTQSPPTTTAPPAG